MSFLQSTVFLSLLSAGFFLGSLFFPFSAFAHGSGASFEEQVDKYLLDVGYEPEKFLVGQSVVFDFLLYEVDPSDPENKKTVPFTNVWVRLSQNDKALLATGIAKQRLGGTALTYTFAEPGQYSLDVRFENEQGEIVKHTFPLEVAGDDLMQAQEVGQKDWGEKKIGVVGITTFGAGLLVGYWWFRVRK